MGWQVIGGGQGRIGEPHSDGPVDEGHEDEMDSLVPGSAVIAAIEGELVHQVEVEPGRFHCLPLPRRTHSISRYNQVQQLTAADSSLI